MSYAVSSDGYFGEFGGAFVPEMLFPNVDELSKTYIDIIQSDNFKKDFSTLLKDYVGRPSPLYYAERLSNFYECNLYLKREDLNHTGSHKINNTIGQILLAKALNKNRIIAETGAGQHGVATATVCALMGIECTVFMGAVDVERQQPNVQRMNLLGATVVAVESGSKTLKDATNEAMREWIRNPSTTHYIIGSVVGPHPFPDMVARFQSVISQEIKAQLLEKIGRDYPDFVVACVGGGSNAIGAFYHYLNNEKVSLIGVEAGGEGVSSGRSAATTSLGRPGVLHGSKTIFMQSIDGQVLEAHSISAGLDYPGIGPQHAHLHQTGRVQYLNVTDTQALDAVKAVIRYEGIIPALETGHAFAVLNREIFKNKIVVLNLSGSGQKDLDTFSKELL
jgi:tryptophan synthase beta chain